MRKNECCEIFKSTFFYWTPPVNLIIDFITINNVFEQLFYRTPPVNFIIDFITINNVQFLSDGTSFSIRLQRMPLLLGRCCFISCFDVIEYCYKFKINHGSSYKIDLQCAAQIDMILSVNSNEYVSIFIDCSSCLLEAHQALSTVRWWSEKKADGRGKSKGWVTYWGLKGFTLSAKPR